MAKSLEDVMGVSRAKLDEIWLGVKANHARLDACTLHDFSVDTTPERSIDKKWKCAACGGIVGDDKKRWYEKGRAHEAGRTHE